MSLHMSKAKNTKKVNLLSKRPIWQKVSFRSVKNLRRKNSWIKTIFCSWQKILIWTELGVFSKMMKKSLKMNKISWANKIQWSTQIQWGVHGQDHHVERGVDISKPKLLFMSSSEISQIENVDNIVCLVTCIIQNYFK